MPVAAPPSQTFFSILKRYCWPKKIGTFERTRRCKPRGLRLHSRRWPNQLSRFSTIHRKSELCFKYFSFFGKIESWMTPTQSDNAGDDSPEENHLRDFWWSWKPVFWKIHATFCSKFAGDELSENMLLSPTTEGEGGPKMHPISSCFCELRPR